MLELCEVVIGDAGAALAIPGMRQKSDPVWPAALLRARISWGEGAYGTVRTTSFHRCPFYEEK